LAVINDSDVGLKTDLITINPSQLRSVYTHTHTHTHTLLSVRLFKIIIILDTFILICPTYIYMQAYS